MPKFSTKIILEEISTKGNGNFSGKFIVDILERFNIYREFKFIVNKFNSPDCRIVIFKDKEIFLEYKKNSKRQKRKKYSKEQQLIYASLIVILSAYINKLDASKFALTKIENYGKLSVITGTEDQLGGVLIRACL